jgi:lysozyme family protein
MIANFEKSLEMVLRHEGGFVNHPDDPGGMTNKGITAAVLAAHLGRDVTAADMRNISDQTVATIYRRNYWDAARCSLMPDGLDYAVFDFAVNSGVSRAVRMLQTILGVKADGVIGDITANAIRSTDTMDLIEELCTRRMAFLKGLRTWRTFGRGWTRRVMGRHDGAQGIEDDGVIDRAQAMLMGAATTLPRAVDDGANAKAREDDVSAATTVKAAVRDPEVLATVGSIATAAFASGNGDGPLAYGISAVLVIGAVACVIMLLRKRNA